ncbi:Crp/Fnr family transcriptional regulator [Anaerosalibacter massiliensis]|uniref:Crp/Fnr family transcriptional regulator n=1 Tax=Anaerosalibacter massiliensis TaxID=1347392 RepID=A0A9X2MLN8_9FIRM|nr:Crp/Fnr family transcriptional regulator [Anaerosalibacter massiliensis]MCR2043461.1 Crp/Fnr family transcriptional regulator [Anaerosalibacter massiliensis]
MDKIVEVLNKCVLFKSINNNEITEALKGINYEVSNFKKDEIIAIEEEECISIGIILDGIVEIQKTFPSGNIVTLNRFKSGNIFGEAIVFSKKHVYPATIVAVDNSKVMFVHKNDIIRLCSISDKFLGNFMTVLSNRILMLNSKIKILSHETIRKKIANFLLDEYSKQDNKFLEFSYGRKKMAEVLNVPRPSLSRELIKMRDEGIIDFDRNVIKIIDVNLLEKCLIN